MQSVHSLLKWVAVPFLLTACNSTTPSARLQSRIDLPVPGAVVTLLSSERLSQAYQGEDYALSARALIPVAFNRQPDIKSSFEEYKSEEARYDFFYSSLDSLTPRMRVVNNFNELRASQQVSRNRQHTTELSVEKRFFDTTQLEVAVGLLAEETDGARGNSPFVSADLRYPFWVSREKLGRTSEDIFRRNELDDAQLDYIEEVRDRLQDAMLRFYDTQNLRRVVDNLAEWQGGLEELADRLDSIRDRDVSADRRRLLAELAKVTADGRNLGGRYEIQMARLKAAIGLPFHARLELLDEAFNPFEGYSHGLLLRMSIATDPEIATHRNAMRNAEVQLDLARRGKWDIALLLSGTSTLEGSGESEGLSDWTVSVGLDFSAVDARVTDSLIRQAQANINRFGQAIVARENSVFADTLEPLIRIDTLGTSRGELIGNLARYEDDYAAGVAAYIAGTLNIDDLLKRRENVFLQQDEISRLTFLLGANVAELCSATGKFFDLLGTDPPGDLEPSSE